MKEKKESDYEKQLNTKIEERLSNMENSDYVFAKPFSKYDYLITFAVALLCIVFIIIGAYL